MKCVKCGTNNNGQEQIKNEGKCKNCNHPFAFYKTPRYPYLLTDVFFKNTIQAITNDNTLFFTKKQFVYFLNKRKNKKLNKVIEPIIFCLFLFLFFGLGILMILTTPNRPKDFSIKVRKAFSICIAFLGVAVFVGGIIWGLTYSDPAQGFSAYLIACIFALFLVYFGVRQFNQIYQFGEKLVIEPEKVNNYLNSWMEINGSIEKLLPSPKEESSNIEISSSLSAYSFDRVLVCDRAEIAQFLIANNFYFENNCAVLSVTGYPQSIFSTIMEMLRRNPDLKVYAFHNASPRGIALVNHLRVSPNWFSNCNAAIYDLGLLPRQVFNSNNMSILKSSESAREAKQMPAAVRENLSAKEIAWLEAGCYVELESFSPQRLLRVVSRGIANSQSISGGESWSGNDGDNLIVGGDSYLFVSDSFG